MVSPPEFALVFFSVASIFAGIYFGMIISKRAHRRSHWLATSTNGHVVQFGLVTLAVFCTTGCVALQNSLAICSSFCITAVFLTTMFGSIWPDHEYVQPPEHRS